MYNTVNNCDFLEIMLVDSKLHVSKQFSRIFDYQNNISLTICHSNPLNSVFYMNVEIHYGVRCGQAAYNIEISIGRTGEFKQDCQLI